MKSLRLLTRRTIGGSGWIVFLQDEATISFSKLDHVGSIDRVPVRIERALNLLRYQTPP